MTDKPGVITELPLDDLLPEDIGRHGERESLREMMRRISQEARTKIFEAVAREFRKESGPS